MVCVNGRYVSNCFIQFRIGFRDVPPRRAESWREEMRKERESHVGPAMRDTRYADWSEGAECSFAVERFEAVDVAASAAEEAAIRSGRHRRNRLVIRIGRIDADIDILLGRPPELSKSFTTAYPSQGVDCEVLLPQPESPSATRIVVEISAVLRKFVGNTED